MQTLRFDLSKKYGAFKPLNAVNGGPCYKRHATDQWKTNFPAYKAARIPYTRNHDSGVSAFAGGPYSIDVDKIFRNFDADPNDPESYDFPCTDESILVPLEADTKTFYRLGATIEHQIKKHATIPPKDFHKWAVICEHIIRHYTEGWADGFKLDIEYWEIWNEPDLDPDDSTNKRTWGGTKAQFFDFYEVAAKHLKGCFPNLKIGGPAIAHRVEWCEDFLCEMQKRNVPLDFFSWHIYSVDPNEVIAKGEKYQALLKKYGYENAENILNEWNYVKGWTEEFIYSIETIGNIKGACFTMATMALSQPSCIDMLMYYDARLGAFCGLFDTYTCRTRKPYYAFYWYGMFYDMEAEIRTDDSIDDIYSLCGCDKESKTLHVLTYYTDDDDVTEEKTFTVDYGKKGEYEIYLHDAERDAELVKVTDDLTITMKPNTMILIKEK